MSSPRSLVMQQGYSFALPSSEGKRQNPSTPSRTGSPSKKGGLKSPNKGKQKQTEAQPQHISVDFDNFYNDRVQRFDSERQIYQSYLKILEPKKQEIHHLVWQNKKLIEQSRLSRYEKDQINARTTQIQQEIVKVRQEIEEQTKAQVERREQIAKLKELTGPVEHDQTYIVKENFPMRRASNETKQTSPMMRTNRLSSADAAFNADALQDKRNRNKKGMTIAEREYSKAMKRPMWKILKTGDIVQLEGRLRDETVRSWSYLQQLEKAIVSAEEDNHRLVVQYNTVNEEDMKNATELWEEVDKYEFQCYHAVAELLRLRFRIMVAQREEVEELERLQYDKALFIEKEEKLKYEVSFLSIKLLGFLVMMVIIVAFG